MSRAKHTNKLYNYLRGKDELRKKREEVLDEKSRLYHLKGKQHKVTLVVSRVNIEVRMRYYHVVWRV
jgi:hypothetical protein